MAVNNLYFRQIQPDGVIRGCFAFLLLSDSSL